MNEQPVLQLLRDLPVGKPEILSRRKSIRIVFSKPFAILRWHGN
jgi:hypothetical protein